jgi:hypothetical protein
MRRGVSPTSDMRAGVQAKSGHSFWAKYREVDDVVDLQELFKDYWASKKNEFTVTSQS